jgi:hypothetical protein
MDHLNMTGKGSDDIAWLPALEASSHRMRVTGCVSTAICDRANAKVAGSVTRGDVGVMSECSTLTRRYRHQRAGP